MSAPRPCRCFASLRVDYRVAQDVAVLRALLRAAIAFDLKLPDGHRDDVTPLGVSAGLALHDVHEDGGGRNQRRFLDDERGLRAVRTPPHAAAAWRALDMLHYGGGPARPAVSFRARVALVALRAGVALVPLVPFVAVVP